MKFTSFKEFRFSQTIEDVAAYLSTDLRKYLKELEFGLTKLKFTENFESFEVTVTIPASAEVSIPNRLDAIPSKRVFVRSNSSSIVDGDTEWTRNLVYLKNTSASAATLTVVFFK